jgi:ATPase subunit of ABC transporter with duplicated ATPase domains
MSLPITWMQKVYWLEQHLAQYSGTVIAVTHDRYFLDNVAGWILELDRGEVFHGKETTLLGWTKVKLWHLRKKCSFKRKKT